jgi:hypothetical protein
MRRQVCHFVCMRDLPPCLQKDSNEADVNMAYKQNYRRGIIVTSIRFVPRSELTG